MTHTAHSVKLSEVQFSVPSVLSLQESHRGSEAVDSWPQLASL